jgi:hypothetical protein
MLVARTPFGVPVEATRELTPGAYACPLCSASVILKPGRVKVAHFAHTPGADCAAAGESIRHLAAKRLLADRFRDLGYGVLLEESHPRHARRVDVAVSLPSGHRIAVEVQDSPIEVLEMKRRQNADRAAGFFGTAWVFVGRRAALLLADEGEVRVPPEIRWLANRYQQGVFVLDTDAGQMYRATFGDVFRDGSYVEWRDGNGDMTSQDYPGRTLRATKSVGHEPVGFALTCAPSQYHRPGSDDWAVIFT